MPREHPPRSVLVTTFVLRCSMFSGFRASGEAILGTQRYLHDAKAILGTQRYFLKHLLIIFVRASGEAILGTQRYFIKALYTSILSMHFTQALYPSTLHKHFIKALYTSTLSKHFIQALYQGISKAF